MAVVVESLQRQGADSAAALMQFMHTLWKIEPVQRVAYAVHGNLPYIWVVLRSGEDSAMEPAIMAERDFRRVIGARIDVQFFALDEIEEHLLPEGKILFERP